MCEHRERTRCARRGAPAQARRVRNVFVAPDYVVASPVRVTVKFMPATTRTEVDAIAVMFAASNALRHSLPGEREGRRVKVQRLT